jgi:hypothetical protein
MVIFLIGEVIIMTDRTVREKMAEKSWKENRLKMMEEQNRRWMHWNGFLHERRKANWLNRIGRGNYTPRNGRPC